LAIFLASGWQRIIGRGFFEKQRMVFHPAVANAGNLVKIEDGCATVTGYKLPKATGSFVEPGRRECGLKPGSQDISAVTLVGPRTRGATSPTKRRMRPVR
jgi:hypothetical protein